jgi:hypothetical protein
MITRRAFHQRSLAGLALVGTAFQSWTHGIAAATDDADSHLPLYAVVYERGIASSVVFGAAATRLGLSTHGVDGGDITDVWTRHLADEWRKEPVTIAGLTTYAPLFCLERFGWDHGLRVTFRGEHRLHPDGTIGHQLSGPVPMLRAFAAVAARPEGYGVCLAGVIGRCSQRSMPASTASMVTPAAAADRGSERLYSWVIAPRARAASDGTTVHVGGTA